MRNGFKTKTINIKYRSQISKTKSNQIQQVKYSQIIYFILYDGKSLVMKKKVNYQ